MKNFLRKIFNIIYIIIIAYIIYNMFTVKNIISYNKPILYLVAIIYTFFMLLLYKNIEKKQIKKYMFIVIFIIIIILQIISGYLFEVLPRWDFGKIYEEAKRFSELIANTNYFYMYPNNIPTMLMLKSIFYIFNLLNIKQFMEIGIGVNIIAIDVSILFLVLTIKEILGRKKAFFALISIAILPVIYLSVPIFYTDTLSMPFAIIILYTYIKLKKQENTKIKIIYSLFIGLITVIGMHIKITVLIVFIAIALYEILLNRNMKIKNILYILISILTIIATITLEIITIKYTYKDSYKIRDQSFPATHFIMMSLKNEGSYSEKDKDFTMSFDTKEEKIEANLNEIKEELKKYNSFTEIINSIRKKQLKIWNEGTFGIDGILCSYYFRSSWIQDMIYKDNDIYIYFSQVQRVSLMILMLISVFIKRKNEKLEEDINYIIRLCVVGIIIFFSFWEVRSRYIINYIPIFTIISTFGIDVIDETLMKIKEKLHKNTIQIKKINDIIQ